MELHLEPSVYTARVSLFSTRRPRTYPASLCPLLIPCVHLHTHRRSFTVERLHWALYIIQDLIIMLLRYDVFVVQQPVWGLVVFVFSYLGKIFGKTILQKAKQGKTFGVCQLLRADSKCEIEKQEYFNYFCSNVGLKLNIH